MENSHFCLHQFCSLLPHGECFRKGLKKQLHPLGKWMIDSCSNTFLSQPHITTVSLNTGPSQWLTGVAGLLTLYASPPGYSKHMKHIHNLPLYNKIRSKLERFKANSFDRIFSFSTYLSSDFWVLNLFFSRFFEFSQFIF